MRSSKDSHLITVRDAQYRWRATGNDGWISIVIWPSDNPGPTIAGSFDYHQKFVKNEGRDSWSAVDQLIVTSRLIARVIEHAISARAYDPAQKGPQLNLGKLEEVIRWEDGLRLSDARGE